MSNNQKENRTRKGKTSHSVSTFPMSQAKLKKEIRNEIRKQEVKELEHKFFDTATPGGFAVAGTVTAISNVPQGVGQSQRIGDEITPIELNLTLTNFTTAVGAPGNVWRLAVIEWFDSTVPTIASLLTSALPTAEWLWANNDLFEVLFDRMWSAASNVGAGVSNAQSEPCYLSKPIVLRNRERKLRNQTVARPRKQTFNPGATTGTSQLYLIMIGLSAAATATGQTRLQYLDG
jgi:hypothetical protein